MNCRTSAFDLPDKYCQRMFVTDGNKHRPHPAPDLDWPIRGRWM